MKALTISIKRSILEVSKGFEYTSDIVHENEMVLDNLLPIDQFVS